MGPVHGSCGIGWGKCVVDFGGVYILGIGDEATLKDVDIGLEVSGMQALCAAAGLHISEGQ